MKPGPSPVPSESPSVAELFARLSETFGQLAEAAGREGWGLPAAPATKEKAGDQGTAVMTSRELAAWLGRSLDWLYEHRGEFVSANVSGKGQRARYGRRLVEEILERNVRLRGRRS